MCIHYYNHEASCCRSSLLDASVGSKAHHTVGEVFDRTTEGRFFLFSGKVDDFWPLKKRKKRI